MALRRQVGHSAAPLGPWNVTLLDTVCEDLSLMGVEIGDGSQQQGLAAARGAGQGATGPVEAQIDRAQVRGMQVA
jgi:hypothetical protein